MGIFFLITPFALLFFPFFFLLVAFSCLSRPIILISFFLFLLLFPLMCFFSFSLLQTAIIVFIVVKALRYLRKKNY